MTAPYTAAQLERAFEILQAGQRQAEADGFWEQHLGPRPWPPGIARAVEEHDHPAPEPQPQPADVADMSMQEYVANRDRLGVRDSNGILGSEIKPWQKTTRMENQS